MAKLKVYGGDSHLNRIQERTIAAVTSQTQFAKLIHANIGYVRDYCCETGNEKEITLAMSDIGAVFVECELCRNWHKFVEAASSGEGVK